MGPLVDPSQRADIMKRLREHVEVLEDEHGVTYEIIPLKDASLPGKLFANFDRVQGMGFQDIRKLHVRDDDTFVCDYGKSGTPSATLTSNFH